jgi:2-dehydropantoate 2-reductase
MRFFFLGMGAVGSLWASILLDRGYKVFGFCRGKHYNEILKKGLTFERLDGKISTIKQGNNFEIFDSFRAGKKVLETITDEDWLIITSKAYSLSEIITEYHELLKDNESVLLLQNGLGNEEIIKEKIPKIKVYRGTTTMGAYLVKSGHIRHTGTGFTILGYPLINYENEGAIPKYAIDKIRELTGLFNEVGIKSEYSDKIDLLLWEKIFINIGINAPASVRNITNGELVQSAEIMELMRNAITEAWKVGKAMNIPLDDNPDRYVELAYDVARKTANNKNSMLQDLINKKPTEIDFINGKIVKLAKKLGIKVPENEDLTQKITELESEFA